jgi:hypothetical protein
MPHYLFHSLLSEYFTAEGEELASDLSGVWINLIKNVHDDTLEMTIEVFGKDGTDEDPIITEFIFDPENYLAKNFIQPAICPRCILNLFEDKLINLFIKKNLIINWNHGWWSKAVIDPANLHLTPKLEAEDQ